MLRYVFLALLAVVSIIHLIDSYNDATKKRPRTKWALLPLIIAYYLSSTQSPSWVLIAALVTSWIGDVLLIPQGTAWFAAGGLSFLAAHVSFVCLYIPQVVFSAVNWFVVVPVALVYIAVTTTILVLLKKKTPKLMFIPMFLYLLINATMNIFALMQLITNPCAGSVVAYIGAVLFYISDCSLYLNKYYEKPVVFKKHFTIMLTYILGELLITQGMLMLGL